MVPFILFYLVLNRKRCEGVFGDNKLIDRGGMAELHLSGGAAGHSS